jgi:hypothetical protein
MAKRKRSPDDPAKKVRALARLADELRAGESFNVTRLTVVKGLCAEQRGRVRFAHRIATLARKAMEQNKRPAGVSAAEWERFRKTVGKAVDALGRYAKRPGADPPFELWTHHGDLQRLQNKVESIGGGPPVRVIKNLNALAVEYAVGAAIANDKEGASYAYRAARAYAERYDSKTGRDLSRASAPMVREIAEFWCEHFFEKPLDAWLAAPAAPRKAASAAKAPAARRRATGSKKTATTRPTASDDFAARYPHLTRFVRADGILEIGYWPGGSGSFVRLLLEDNLLWESADEFATMDALFEALEIAVREEIE